VQLQCLQRNRFQWKNLWCRLRTRDLSDGANATQFGDRVDDFLRAKPRRQIADQRVRIARRRAQGVDERRRTGVERKHGRAGHQIQKLLPARLE